MTNPDVRTSVLSRLRARLAPRHDDQGMALIAVILLATVMSMIAGVIIFDATTELRRSSAQVVKTSAVQAAQSGIDDYLAKMTQDNLYYFHYVHAGEPVRTPGTPGIGTYAWTGASTWGYSATRRWVPVGTSGFEYSFKVTAPTIADTSVTVVSTGRKLNDPNMANWRSIQTKVRGSSVADYQMVADASIAYGAGATTNGRIYTTGALTHDGTATADLLAEGNIYGGVTMVSPGAGKPVPVKYDSATIRSQIPVPVDFNTFTTALATVKAVAASVGKTYDVTGNVWWIKFKTGSPKGLFDIFTCSTVVDEGSPTVPTCTTVVATNVAVPDIGAFYFGQRVIVSGVVQGQVTIASNADVLVGNNITYNTPGTSTVTGLDILGLIAKTDIVVPEFAPHPLTWYSATVAMTGFWHNGNGATGVGTLNFYGSTATKQGGSMSALFTTRNYNYDLTLAYLQPPFFPVITVNYQVLLFREITSTP